ncbi:hypothetical protein ACROYT_G005845 [Oculina patagonica]
MQEFVNTHWTARRTCIIMALIVWLSYIDITSAEVTATGDACFDEPLTVRCEALQRVDRVVDVEWKVRNPNNHQWIRFAYCDKSMACMVMKPRLPNGIKVMNISNGNLTLQRSTKNSTNSQAQLKCEVHHSDNSINYHVREINFTVCIKTQEAADVNLTRVLRNMLPWKQVVDIEVYYTNERFAYCNTGGCTKVNDSHDPVPVFWNRLQVNHGSLLLTGIEENDNGREIKVTVHLKASPDDSKAKRAAGMQTVRVYTLKIFVLNSSQEPKLELPITPPTTRTDRTSLPPSSSHAESPKRSSASAANGQEWTVAVMTSAVFLGTMFGS